MMQNKKLLLVILAVVAIIALILASKELKKAKNDDQAQDQNKAAAPAIDVYSFSATVSKVEGYGIEVQVAYPQVDPKTGVAKAAYTPYRVKIDENTSFTRQKNATDNASLVAAKRSDIKVGSTVVIYSSVDHSQFVELTASRIDIVK